MPVIKALIEKTTIPVSIDTKKASVAQAALEAGASMINDISALSHDPLMIDVALKSGAGVILMHMRGTPMTMQHNTGYHDIIGEICEYLDERIEACLVKGLDPASILIDPGIGFGKDVSGNLSLIKHISEFRSLGVPVVLGHSRKSFIGTVLDAPVNERQEGTDAVSAWAMAQGIEVLRVHDVHRTRRMRDMLSSVRSAQ